ncbi:hypothetical protein NKG05_14875 [Oerskovia sp. M15]
MVHATAVPYLEPLTGDPAQLEQAGTHYLTVADQIRAVSRGLADISSRSESIGESADAARPSAGRRRRRRAGDPSLRDHGERDEGVRGRPLGRAERRAGGTRHDRRRAQPALDPLRPAGPGRAGHLPRVGRRFHAGRRRRRARRAAPGGAGSRSTRTPWASRCRGSGTPRTPRTRRRATRPT